MEQEVNQKIVSIGMQSARDVGAVLREAIRAYINHSSNVKAKKAQSKATEDHLPQKRKVKDLVKSGKEISNIELKNEDVKDFERLARKQGVKYAITKDKATNPPTYYFFFQAKDAKVIETTFRKFLNANLKEKDKPSIKQRLGHFKEIVANQKQKQDKDRNRQEVR